jgi:UDP-3-O-[3-hydroxymyristoyl] glucosamine N-acyltransferase
MDVPLSEIMREFPQVIREHHGDNTIITGIGSVEDCGLGDLVFVADEKMIPSAAEGQPSGVVLPNSLLPLIGSLGSVGILVSDNVRLAHALIKQRYADRNWFDGESEPVHPSAIIHPSVQIPESSFVGANVVVAKDVIIGERCRLLAGSIIERGVVMGDDCLIHSTALIGYESQLGEQVEIGAGSVIGSEGYGFAQDAAGKSHRIPQTGKVVIEDRVRIGAHNCIDRAAFGVTRIGAGTKTDNLCHIAHGVDVGEDCLLTAMFCVAGSTKIGNRVMASGQTGILGHLTICDDVGLVHRAAVTQDIKQPGIYAGLPLQPLKRHMKSAAQLKKLDDLASKVRNLEAELKALKSELKS